MDSNVSWISDKKLDELLNISKNNAITSSPVKSSLKSSIRRETNRKPQSSRLFDGSVRDESQHQRQRNSVRFQDSVVSSIPIITLQRSDHHHKTTTVPLATMVPFKQHVGTQTVGVATTEVGTTEVKQDGGYDRPVKALEERMDAIAAVCSRLEHCMIRCEKAIVDLAERVHKTRMPRVVVSDRETMTVALADIVLNDNHNAERMSPAGCDKSTRQPCGKLEYRGCAIDCEWKCNNNDDDDNNNAMSDQQTFCDDVESLTADSSSVDSFAEQETTSYFFDHDNDQNTSDTDSMDLSISTRNYLQKYDLWRPIIRQRQSARHRNGQRGDDGQQSTAVSQREAEAGEAEAIRGQSHVRQASDSHVVWVFGNDNRRQGEV